MAEKDKSVGLTRRNFIKGAAAGLGAAALVKLSIAEARPIRLDQVSKWDDQADVVLLGSGTGLIAALRAIDKGATVLVVEKAATAGGTTAVSGGGIWAPNNDVMKAAGLQDSRDEALQYLRQATFGQSEEPLLETYVDTVNQMLPYVTLATGIQWRLLGGTGLQFADYYGSFAGSKPRGRTVDPTPASGLQYGALLMSAIQKTASNWGARFRFKTAAKKLIINQPAGASVPEVVGVVADVGGQLINIKANRAVIVATGGFDWNPPMCAHFLRGPLYYPSAASGNTGDGQIMGAAIGAELRNMNSLWGWPVYYNTAAHYSISALALELGKPGTIVVNKHGERFMNEAGAYPSVTRSFYYYDSGTFEYRNVPGFLIVDSEYQKRYTLAFNPPGAPVPSWIARGDTLAALAAELNIDAAALQATVATFNQNAAQGIDPQFHRGELPFDLQTGGDPSRKDLANPCLAPVATPPFYGVPIWPGALGTCGGLHINTNAQVLTPFGDVIPRLYATGNASGSVMGAGYPGGGATVGAGLTFGYIAGAHGAALQPWT